MMTKHRAFSMIEVILALIIIAIAIVAITGVFPISMRMHNNAMRQNQAVDVAQELMNFAAYRTRRSTVLPITFPLSEDDIMDLVENASLDINNSDEWKVNNTLLSMAGTQYFFYNDPGTKTMGHTVDEGIIRVFRKHDAYRGDKKIQVTELDIVIAIWRSDDSSAFYFKDYNTTTGSLEFQRGTLKDAHDVDNDDMDTLRLNLEASWPGSSKYEDRDKIRMVMEVNRRE